MAAPLWRADPGGDESYAGDGTLAAESNDSVLTVRLTQLGISVRDLTEDVRRVEARQVHLDRRLVEFTGLLQGMQEEQYTQSKTLAFGAQRALSTAVTVQRQLEQEDEWQTCLGKLTNNKVMELEKEWEARFREQKQCLMDLHAEIAEVAFQASKAAAAPPVAASLTPPPSARRSESAPRDGQAHSELSFTGRLEALEQGQKAVAISARRALQTAIVVHQQQQQQLQPQSVASQSKDRLADDAWSASSPFAEIESLCLTRFGEQEERIEKVLQVVDALTDKILEVGSAVAAVSEEFPGGARESGTGLVGSPEWLRERVEGLEAHIYGLAMEMQQRGLSRQDSTGPDGRGGGSAGTGGPAMGIGPGDPPVDKDSILTAVSNLEGRMNRTWGEVVQRLDVLQDGRDQQRLLLRQMSHQLPEVSQKLEQLWSQCQEYFPRVQEHEVHVSFLRKSFESHKQQMLELVELIDHPVLGTADEEDEEQQDEGNSYTDAASTKVAKRLKDEPNRGSARATRPWLLTPAVVSVPPTEPAASDAPVLAAAPAGVAACASRSGSESVITPAATAAAAVSAGHVVGTAPGHVTGPGPTEPQSGPQEPLTRPLPLGVALRSGSCDRRSQIVSCSTSRPEVRSVNKPSSRTPSRTPPHTPSSLSPSRSPVRGSSGPLLPPAAPGTPMTTGAAVERQ